RRRPDRRPGRRLRVEPGGGPAGGRRRPGQGGAAGPQVGRGEPPGRDRPPPRRPVDPGADLPAPPPARRAPPPPRRPALRRGGREAGPPPRPPAQTPPPGA